MIRPSATRTGPSATSSASGSRTAASCAAPFPAADLREATFKTCGFADAEGQQGANFAFTRLDEAAFENCNLAHARFEGADLYAVRFTDCRLLGTRFARARFHRAFGRKVVRTAATFNDCNLDLADFSNVVLAGCDLSNSRFQEADLFGADLEGANLTRTDLFHAILDGAKLAGADLRDADVSGLDLRRLGTSKDLKINADQQFVRPARRHGDRRAGGLRSDGTASYRRRAGQGYCFSKLQEQPRTRLGKRIEVFREHFAKDVAVYPIIVVAMNIPNTANGGPIR